MNNLPIPPPLTLEPPKLSDTSYEFARRRKHLMMINEEEQFHNIKEEVEKKYQNVYNENEEKFTQEGDASTYLFSAAGELMMGNITLYEECKRCQRWILKSQLSIHRSCHSAIIRPNLLLGDKFSSRSRKELIQREKVTHVVNCAAELDNKFEEEGIIYLKLELNDDLVENPIDSCVQAAKFMKKAMDEGGKIFVHCSLGRSRSVSAILVYMLLYENIPIEEGLKQIKQKRPIAKPNVSYAEKLRQFEKKVNSSEQ